MKPPTILILALADNPLLVQLLAALSEQGLNVVSYSTPAQTFMHLVNSQSSDSSVSKCIILDPLARMAVGTIAASLRGLPRCNTLPLILVDTHATALPATLVFEPPGQVAEIVRFAAMPAQAWPTADTGSVLGACTPPPDAGTSQAIFDRQRLMALDAKKPGTLSMLAGILLADLSPFRAEVTRHLAQGDLTTLGRVAHKLKGSSGSLGAMELHEACFALEMAARATDVEGCSRTATAVLSAVDRLSPILAEVIKTGPKPHSQQD
jgi:HPt (histidine-containing phosphotransfer) domain-containing protein